MTRLRIIVVALLLATVFAAASGAASPRELLPGVTYERIAQRTLQGPLVLHVVRAPRPGGLYDLRPVLATDTIVGRETVTSMQKRLAGEATMVGVNADFFDLAVGRPSGILMRDTALIHPPTGGRSSVGITLDGRLDVQRVQFFATWRATGEAHPLDDLNQAPGPNEIALFSSSWGSVTPAVPGAVVAILFPLPLPAPGADLTAPVLELRQASAPVPIPPGGAVLVATGSAAAELQAEAPVGSEVAIQLILRPEWPEVVHAVGGGPVIVRDGKPVFRANEEFLQSQLGPRFPRTAVGQTADGRLLLVTVDGRSAESVGVTNWGLAQAMVRLGAVTAAAMDSGGSSTLAFDGVVLNTPSDRRGERPVADALMLAYTGVYAPPGEVVTSALRPLEVDRPVALTYKVVRPSTVTATLTAPDGSTPFAETVERLPGVYDVTLPGEDAVPLAEGEPASGAPMQGTWELAVEATDDLGTVSRMRRKHVVNRTIQRLTVAPRPFRVPPRGRDIEIRWTQASRGFATVTIEGRGGAVVRTLAQQRFEPGEATLAWNGLDRTRKRVPGGFYHVRIVSKNVFGVLEVEQKLKLIQVRGPKPERSGTS